MKNPNISSEGGPRLRYAEWERDHSTMGVGFSRSFVRNSFRMHNILQIVLVIVASIYDTVSIKSSIGSTLWGGFCYMKVYLLSAGHFYLRIARIPVPICYWSLIGIVWSRSQFVTLVAIFGNPGVDIKDCSRQHVCLGHYFGKREREGGRERRL